MHLNDSLIPPRYRILSGSMLKLIAVFSMLVDHTAAALLYSPSLPPLFQIGSHPITLYSLMRGFGRLAFPLYCFLLVEGFSHTKNALRYGKRLLFFALISEIPWNLAFHNSLFYKKQNVYFTLFLGFSCMYLIRRFLQNFKEKKPFWKEALLLALPLCLAYFIKADYGLKGLGIILLFYFLREWPPLRAAAGIVFLSWKQCLALIPIALYNGKRGFVQSRGLALGFYLFYPLHLLILFFIRKLVIGN